MGPSMEANRQTKFDSKILAKVDKIESQHISNIAVTEKPTDPPLPMPQ